MALLKKGHAMAEQLPAHWYKHRIVLTPRVVEIGPQVEAKAMVASGDREVDHRHCRDISPDPHTNSV
jgi:hypothetical protein